MTHHPIQLTMSSFLRACLLVMLLAGSASAVSASSGVLGVPEAEFSGTPTSGTAPLLVQFSDLSVGDPTGWAWYFGDEDFMKPWMQMTEHASWSIRQLHSSVVLPDGSIVLMGGYGNSVYKNDVWRSEDKGASWTQMTAVAEWTARSGHTSVVLSDGSIVLMGGFDGSFKNDVWISSDQGATWEQMTASAEWTARDGHTSVTLPDDSIVLMGGFYLENDVWRSTNKGATWTQMTDSAEWSGREHHASVVLPDGSIVLLGGWSGNNNNDVWHSTDLGATWTQIFSGYWWARKSHTSVAMPDGSIVLMGGYRSYDPYVYLNDVWRLSDMDATWTRLTDDAAWTERCNHTSVVLPDGSIVLMGGSKDGYTRNDVWRLETAGSMEQNSSHSYSEPGTYPVTLQAYTPEGYSSTVKEAYIQVAGIETYSTYLPLAVKMP